jgi:hypothetical protein
MIMLFNAKWANFQLYYGKNKLHFDEIITTNDNVHFVLVQVSTLIVSFP